MRLLLLLLLCCTFILSINAITSSSPTTTATVSGTIKLPRDYKQHQQQYENIENDHQSPFSNTRVLLNGLYRTVYVEIDGSFSIRNVAPGNYLVEIIHPILTFPTYRVDVPDGDFPIRWQTTTGGRIASSTPTLSPISLTKYFTPRPTVAWWSILTQPMTMAMMFMLGMVFIFPKMLNSMDDKDREDMAKLQNSMSITNMVRNIEKKTQVATQER